jgi:hypothetical protein
MGYPTSSDVTVGQPTASAHYNNLRADALRLGQAAADGVNLGDLLAKFETNLSLEYLATNRVRVPASAASPAAVVVNGVPLLATAAVDLPAGSAPSGGAAWWYVFAVQSAGSTSFTLTANTTATEATGTRRIGRFYWDGSSIGQLKTEYRGYLETLLGLGAGPVCEGRLTLTTGSPITTANVTAATVLYFAPYRGGRVSLWSLGFGWKVYRFDELSITLTGKTANKNYDVFLYDNAGTLTLELVEWTNDSSRATAIVLLDGVYVKIGDGTRLYLGTIRITGTTGQTEDSETRRFVWNFYNAVSKFLTLLVSGQHTYTAGAQRLWNNDATKAEFLIPVVGGPLLLNTIAVYSGNTGGAVNSSYALMDGGSVGYGYDFTPSGLQGGWHSRTAPTMFACGMGYHYLQGGEFGYGTSASCESFKCEGMLLC